MAETIVDNSSEEVEVEVEVTPKTIVLVTGGFDPLHSGHISYLQAAKAMGDHLAVGINSDAWLKRKKGRHFMPLEERGAIISQLLMVDQCVGFENDYDADDSAVRFIKDMREYNPDAQIIFANGGDRASGTTLEEKAGLEKITFAFGVGGTDKKNSSSWILKEWNLESETRVWGKFFNLHQDKNVKVKELVVLPGKGMSFQRHFYRSEIWLVSKGKCLINFSKDKPENTREIILNTHDHLIVETKNWHQITNPYDVPCHIIEIQYGLKTNEEDIERLYYFDEKK